MFLSFPWGQFQSLQTPAFGRSPVHHRCPGAARVDRMVEQTQKTIDLGKILERIPLMSLMVVNGFLFTFSFFGGAKNQDPCFKHEFPVMHLWLKNDLRPHQFMDGRRFRMTSGRVGGWSLQESHGLSIYHQVDPILIPILQVYTLFDTSLATGRLIDVVFSYKLVN